MRLQLLRCRHKREKPCNWLKRAEPCNRLKRERPCNWLKREEPSNSLRRSEMFIAPDSLRFAAP